MKRKFFTFLSVALIGGSCLFVSCGDKGGSKSSKDDDEKTAKVDSDSIKKAEEMQQQNQPNQQGGNFITPQDVQGMSTEELITVFEQGINVYAMKVQEAVETGVEPNTTVFEANMDVIGTELDKRDLTPEQKARIEAAAQNFAVKMANLVQSKGVNPAEIEELDELSNLRLD